MTDGPAAAARAGDPVSVIIPTFNSARYVEAAVESALRQTYPSLEIIVVDDGSTDGTGDRLARFGDRIQVRSQANAGVCAARNVAARVAKGTLLAFLDADDLWEPHKTERQVAVFQRHPDVAVVAAWFDEIDAEGRRMNRGKKKPEPAFDRPVALHRQLLAHGNVVPLSASVVRREAFLEVGGFYTRDRIRSGDYELWIRLSERHPFYVLSESLCHYRILPQSMLHGSLEREYGAQLNILRMHRHRFTAWSYRRRLSRLYRDWADSAFYEGLPDGWRMWRAALAKDPGNLGAWVLAAQVVAGRLLRRGRPPKPA